MIDVGAFMGMFYVVRVFVGVPVRAARLVCSLDIDAELDGEIGDAVEHLGELGVRQTVVAVDVACGRKASGR